MTTRFPSRRMSRALLVLTAITAPGLLGCDQEDRPLRLDDLSGGEYVMVERMVLLERAKTFALLDRPAGTALLDSLSLAWGDSSLQDTLTGAAEQPLRAEAVAVLLRRVLAAEQDSLLHTSGRDRWTLPLPDPEPAPAPEPKP
jgi:hypothetical protein